MGSLNKTDAVATEGTIKAITTTSRDDRDMQMFLKESGATRSGDLMVFKVNEFDFDPLLLFEDLVAIPSVVINYKIFMAVDRLNIEIEEGEIYGLLGPNGAGKTTTINMLVTRIGPTSGFWL